MHAARTMYDRSMTAVLTFGNARKTLFIKEIWLFLRGAWLPCNMADSPCNSSQYLPIGRRRAPRPYGGVGRGQHCDRDPGSHTT